MKNRIKRLGFKNQTHNKQLAQIPYNFSIEHDYAEKVTTLTLYGIIDSDDWWGDSITPTAVDKALADANGNDLVIRVNSPGGSAPDGVAIYNRLMGYRKEHKAQITAYVDGWACSAASLLPLVADEAIMGLGAMMMIHEATTIEWGTKDDLRKTAGLLEKLEEGLIDIYLTKANKTKEEIQALMDAETWFNAQEAVDIGFATAIMKEESTGTGDDGLEDLKNLVAKLQSDLTDLRNSKPEPQEPEPKKPAKNSGAFLF